MSTFVIGITGGSGSGKTSFINDLRAHFQPDEVCFLSQDNYYRPKGEQRPDDRGIVNFDLPESIDEKAFARDLAALIRKQPVVRKEYTFNNRHAQPGTLQLRPAPVLIVEGIFVFHFEPIRQLIDLKVFLHAKENLKVIRRIKRDQVERNYPVDDVLYRYEHHVLPTFEKYIKPYMELSDLVINNNQSYVQGLSVLSGFIRHQLVRAGGFPTASRQNGERGGAND